MNPGERRPYQFGPRDARGVIFGLRPIQVGIAVVTAILALGLVRASGDGRAPLPLVVVDLVVGGTVAFLPIRGRTLGEWTPLLLVHAFGSLSGRRRTVAPGGRVAAPRVPRAFSAFLLTEIRATDGREVGGIVDRRHGTVTGALLVDGSAFALLDDPERDRAVSGWASVLSSVGTGPNAPVRVQWIERTVPDHRSEIRARASAAVEARRSDSGPVERALDRARASYAALVEAAATGALRHETVVALSVRMRGSESSRATSEARLVAALGALEERLASVGLACRGALAPDALRRYLRQTFTPAELGPPAIGTWPVSCEVNWGSFRTDGLVHATYWVAEWPRSDVSSEFLLPILHGADGRRTLSVVMEPVGTARATRRVEHARTSARADREVRARHGFVQTARLARQTEAVLRREEELAAGHAAYRFSGYVTVSAPDLVALERACGGIEQSASLARLELRRLFGSQDDGFCCSLPVGRGCR